METASDRAVLWARIRGRLQAEFGDGVFKSWLQPMVLDDRGTEGIRVLLPTRFMCQRVESTYGARIRELWREAEPSPAEAVVFAVRPALAEAASREPAPVMSGEPEGANGSSDVWLDSVSAPLDPRFTFGNFVVGKSNELAAAACQRASEAEEAPFNPLFLYGGVGLGKTHLMHAIAWQIRASRPERRVLYLTAESFMYQFIKALRFRDTMAFKDQFRSVDVLMVDDVQFIAGRQTTQEEFFHTFNALVDRNRLVVISADKSPVDLEGIEDRMRSRLGRGLVADIHPTDYELRHSILQNKVAGMPLRVPEDVIAFLAKHVTSNVRELEGALNRLVAQAQLVGREISIEAAREILADLLRAHDRRLTIEEIQRRVAEYYNIRFTDMHSARRARAVARPRQVAMYLAKQLTERSLPDIGRNFRRDHTTVMHAVRRIEHLLETDSSVGEDVTLLRRQLEE